MFVRSVSGKNKDGSERRYAQLVKSERINGRPQHKVLASLGRIDRSEDKKRFRKMAESFIRSCEELEILDLATDLKAESSKEWGPFLIFKRLFKEVGFDKVLVEHLGSYQTEFELVEVIFNMILNRLSDPCSKRQLEFWEEGVEGIEKHSTHQHYRALDYLIEHKDDIERGVFSRMQNLFDTSLDIVLFDTTSLVYFGEGGPAKDKDKATVESSEEEFSLLDYGFSKDRRSDLKQIVVGVLMSKEGVPLGHEVFKGSQNDVTNFSQIIDQVKQKYHIRDVIFVGDRGMVSKKNIAQLEDKGYEYILGYRMRTIKEQERQKVLGLVNLKRLKRTELKYKEVEYEGIRLVVCYNRERAEKDKEYREREVEKLKEKISTGDVKNLIGNLFHRKFVKTEGKKVVLDEEKIKNDALYDGIFVLTTNTNLSGPQVVHRYRDLWQVEHAFRSLKGELEMGPLYHWKDRRIRAHIFICFMAFCLKVALFKKLQNKDKKFSYTQVIRDLKNLHCLHLKIKGKSVKLRTELKDGAKLAFKAIGVQIPKRILEAEISSVVLAK